MNFDIASILYLLTGISLLIPLGIAGAAINQLMAIRIQRPHLVIKEQENLPTYLNDVFEQGISLLQDLGFEFHHCQYSLDLVCHQHSDKWSLVYLNSQTSTFAEISPASTFLDLPGYEIDFWSIASDGTALITMNGRGHTILCGITNAEIHDPMAITLAEVYQSHLDEREDVFGKKPLITPGRDNYIKLQQKLYDGYFLNLMNERAIISTGSNEFRLAFPKARRLLPQVLRGQRRLRKLLHEKLLAQESRKNKTEAGEQISLSGTQFSVEAEVQSYLRMRSAQERTPGGITSRLVLFFLVLVLSYFAFGLNFSAYSVIILLAVLTLHELGHIGSMALFGYRNFQVLFFPLFVDTTPQEKKSPRIWQRAFVYLMGPIPGIVIGLFLLGLSQEYDSALLYEIAIVLLVVNYINLLPVAPLDGGHLIRFTVLERFPSGKLILSGMSAIAFAIGGWYLSEPVFWIIAIILVSTLPWSALEAGVLSELFDPTNEFERLDKEKRLTRLFETFRESRFQKLQYLQKFNLIKGLSDTLLSSGHLGRIGALGLNSIYLGALLFTPPAAIITVIGMDNTAHIVAKLQGEPDEKNWSTIIDNTSDPEEKFATTLKAAQFYTSTQNLVKAQHYLELAEKTLALIYNEENLSRLYQTYSFYFLAKQELSTAEEYQMKVIKLLDQDTTSNAFALATSYQNLASIHEKQQSTATLLDLRTSLSYALNVQLPEERYVIVSILNQLLDKHYETRDYASIKNILLDALSILTRHQDTPGKYVASFIYQELGWLNIENGQLNDSIKQFEKALTLSDDNVIRIVDISQFGYDPFTRANIYLAMAVTQNRAGNFNSAREYMQKAESILKSNDTDSLADYIKSNLPEISESDDVSSEQLSTSKSRTTQRWQMISSLLDSDNIDTQTLQLPKLTESDNSNHPEPVAATKISDDVMPEKSSTLPSDQGDAHQKAEKTNETSQSDHVSVDNINMAEPGNEIASESLEPAN